MSTARSPVRIRARTWSGVMPSTSATRPVVAPVRRASATTSRSSSLIGANARCGAARSASSTAFSASAEAVLRRRRDHHALGGVLGDGLVARGSEGSGVDERKAVHAAMVAVTRPFGHRPDG